MMKVTTSSSKNDQLQKVGIIGGGIWASALAHLMCKNVNKVTLYTRNDEVIHNVNNLHVYKARNRIHSLNHNITATSSFIGLKEEKIIFITTPSQNFRNFLSLIVPYLNESQIFVLCVKGIEETTGMLMSDVIAEVFPSVKNILSLSGPNFADEILLSSPTVTTVGGPLELVNQITNIISSDISTVYLSTDIRGIQVCGATKNIFAIGGGIIAGRNIGHNAHAAFITNAILEMQEIVELYNGNKETVLLPCGIGDLVLSSYNLNSRNMKLGYDIGRQEAAEKNLIKLDEIKNTVEGYRTTKFLYNKIINEKLNLNLCKAIYEILHENDLGNSIDKIIPRLYLNTFSDDLRTENLKSMDI